jgi:hypothetical protein
MTELKVILLGGDRVFGLAYKAAENSLYHGVYIKSIWHKTANKYNIIRSIGLNNLGEMTGTDIFEIAINNYYTRNGQVSSGVISDITFNYPTGGAV